MGRDRCGSLECFWAVNEKGSGGHYSEGPGVLWGLGRVSGISETTLQGAWNLFVCLFVFLSLSI